MKPMTQSLLMCPKNVGLVMLRLRGPWLFHIISPSPVQGVMILLKSIKYSQEIIVQRRRLLENFAGAAMLRKLQLQRRFRESI
jgi:hypothetical protein